MPDRIQSDARANLLYSRESAPLSIGEAWRLLVKSWPFISRYRRLLAFKCGLVLVSLTFVLMTPWPLKIVIDNVIDGHPLTGIPAAILTPIVGTDRTALLAVVTLFLLAAVLLIGMVGDNAYSLNTRVESGGLDQTGITSNEANDGSSLWSGLFGYLETRVTIDLTQRMNQSVRTAIYERFLRSPLALYADQKIGDAVFRVMYDSASIGPVFYRGVLAPVASILMFAMAMIVLSWQFSNQPVILGIAIAFLPLIAIVSGVFGRAIRAQSQSMRERGSDVMAAFEERVAQVQLIKAFGQEERETVAVDSASWASYRATLKMLGIFSVIVIVLTPLAGALVGYAAYYLFSQVINGRMTLGDIVLLASYGAMLSSPMGTIGSTWASIQMPVAGLRRVHSVLDNLGEPTSRVHAENGAPQLDARIGKLEFRDVAIGYGATTVLRDVSMALRAGELIALAGPSGCGKTTLIYSIPRFLEPSSGAIQARSNSTGSIHARSHQMHFGNESVLCSSRSRCFQFQSTTTSATDARTEPKRRCAKRRRWRERLDLSRICPTGMQPCWGDAVRDCRSVRSNESRSRVPCSAGRKSWYSMSQPRHSIPAPNLI